jgi:hypothetical protein
MWHPLITARKRLNTSRDCNEHLIATSLIAIARKAATSVSQ